jgi:hypothetical protein
MKSLCLTIVTFFIAVLALSVAGMRLAAAEPCTGPFVSCAVAVQATCSRDPDGRQRMAYWDQGGNTIQFERCVGRIFEAAGQPNPYKTGITSSGNLTVPRTELLYPFGPP